MKRKGFTLIELLAVIVVLAVVALIAVPVTMNIIETARKQSVKDSVFGLFEAGSIHYVRHADQTSNGTMTFTCDGTNCLNENGEKLKFKGAKPTGGQLIIKSEKDAEAYYIRLGGYCVLGTRDNLDIKKDCNKLDVTKPSLTATTIKTTTKSILIRVQTSDIESGIKQIKYEIDGKTITDNYDLSVVDTNKKFEGLEPNKTYQIKVTVTNGNNLKEEKTLTETTTTLGTLVTKYNTVPDESSNGYYKSLEAYFEYDGTSSVEGYYVKSERNAKSSVAAKKTCGTDTVITDCTSIESTKNMTAGTWYYFESNPVITYDQTASEVANIYASVTDGDSKTAYSGSAIAKIDADAPSVSAGTPTVKSNSITIPITSSDEHSGLGKATCKYSTKEDEYTETTGVTAETTGCVISGIEADKKYYYKVCVKDGVGNKACDTGSASTTAFTVTLKSNNTPEYPDINGYYRKQEWSLDTVGDPTGFYIKSTRAAVSSTGLTKTCGTDTVPGDCTNITSTTNIAAGTWYYTTSKPTITYNSNAESTASLYAKITDGTNSTALASATISKIKTQLNASEIGITVDGAPSLDNVQKALDYLYEKVK